jgi:hypothetical protein
MSVRCLSIHAGYRCRHRGACCTAGWPIPIEADRLTGLQEAVARGRLRAPIMGGPLWDLPGDAPVETPALVATNAQGCVFHDAGARRCAIHRDLGHGALPLACRQFPRVSVADPRGTSVTLSHYCPTAAELLDTRAPIAIVDDAPAFPSGVELVGLDAREALPPLLRPDMLMTWEAWWDWERLSVELLADAGTSPERAVHQLAGIVEQVRGWSPADGPLDMNISRAFRERGHDAPPGRTNADACLTEVLGAVPDDLRPPHLDTPGRPVPDVVRAFLAAHAFANWTAHLGQGLRTWLRSIEAAWALLDRGLGVRQADFLLRHLADPYLLATTWSRSERAWSGCEKRVAGCRPTLPQRG